MPVPGFLTSIADKAQAAIHSSPLAQHIPHGRPTSPDTAPQPTANEAAGQGHKSHTLEALQHQIRTFGQQYSSSTNPIQKIITVSKGVSIDVDSLSRDSKAQSKELYTWGQTEAADLKDVTDRLAYLNFVHGSLASSLAVKLDGARAPLKTLRDAETALTPRRNVRAGLNTQLARIEHDNQKGMEKKTAELKEQIRKAESDDLAQENEVEILKRKAIRESEQAKWDAVREYGEKLVLLAQASTSIIKALPTLPPTSQSPYQGTQATGAARASLQRALDNYKTGHINLPAVLEGSDLSRSDTRSFGESHAKELSSINTSDITQATQPGIPITPPTHAAQAPLPQSSVGHTQPSVQPIDPSHLNLSPAPIPQSHSPMPAAPLAHESDSHVPVGPTVAETGVPVSAGASGPGPSTGSLHDIHSNSPQSANAGKWESAEEEKKRLGAGYSKAYGQEAPRPQETAEEEKKRLEREERERLLQATTSKPADKKDDDLPPYQDM